MSLFHQHISLSSQAHTLTTVARLFCNEPVTLNMVLDNGVEVKRPISFLVEPPKALFYTGSVLTGYPDRESIKEF